MQKTLAGAVVSYYKLMDECYLTLGSVRWDIIETGGWGCVDSFVVCPGRLSCVKMCPIWQLLIIGTDVHAAHAWTLDHLSAKAAAECHTERVTERVESISRS